MLDRSEALYRSGAVAPGPDVVELGAALVSPAELARLGAEIRSRLADFHRAHPLEGGMPKELLRTALDLAPSTFDALVDAVKETERVGSAVKLGDHGVRLDPAHAAARTMLLQRLESSGYKPPAAAELGTDPALIKALAEAGDIVRVGDFYLTAAQARGVRRSVRDRIESHGPQTVTEIKDLLGTTRKYAVPLCEWLDATGATIRRGDERVLGPTP
jgi:selenocysteine-specific elongation factor